MGLNGLEKIQQLSMKPKVLIFIDWFLPGYKAGGPIQSIANLVNQLGEELNISIVTSDKDLGENTSYPHIRPNSWIVKENYRVLYLDEEHQHSKRYNELLTEQDYDVVYFNSMFSVPFTLLPLWAARKRKSKIVLSPRGMLGTGALNIKKRKKQLFLLLFKVSGIAKKITWHATAKPEAAEIKHHFGEKAQIIIAPNLSAIRLEKAFIKIKVINELKLFFLSRIAEKKNLKAALGYLMKVDSKFRIDFTIIGPVDEAYYWLECQQIIDQMPAHIMVNYVGAIPNHKLAESLKYQHFMLLPTLHENFGHVIMEAWQSACPVILSDQTPWRNLEAKGIGLDIALDQPEQFIKAIETAAAMDQESYTRMSEAASAYAQAFTSNPEVLKANRKLFEN